MLAGIYTPDSGSIHIDGKHHNLWSPQDAIAAGVGMVHQHFKLIPVLNAWENISLGEKPDAMHSRYAKHTLNALRNPFIEKKRINEKITQLEEHFGLKTEHDKKVYDMSVGEKQGIEIIKMLYRGATVLILDEPTAVLTPQEIKVLFSMLRNMKEKGCAIIVITHKLNEVMEISDRVTVMRKGKVIATVNTAETNPRELTKMMVGESMSLAITRDPPAPQKGPVLKIHKLGRFDATRKPLLHDVSFELFPGEILGVAGIAGSGQKELCEIITGLQRAHLGNVFYNGTSIVGLSPRQIKDQGVSMCFVPEDRLGMGLVGGMSITDNVLLRSYEKTPGLFVNRAVGEALARKIVSRYSISTPSIQHIVKKLSGGNIQKVLLGREIELAPKVLITAYPVRGLDIWASYSIYELLNEQKKNGVAVLYIGEDLDVLMELCDRLMVLHAGKLMDIVDPKKVSKEDIGLLMMGEKPE
jgi:simple sugar transport system ATP-binding protein